MLLSCFLTTQGGIILPFILRRGGLGKKRIPEPPPSHRRCRGDSRDPPKCVGGVQEIALGPLLGCLGSLLDRLGRLLGRLGCLLGRLGAVLGRPEAMWGRLGAVLGGFGAPGRPPDTPGPPKSCRRGGKKL